MSTTLTTILQLGDSGPDVSQVQTQLQALGLYSGATDGNFGPDLQAAVIQFQQSSGLSADGIVGPETWSALFGVQPVTPTAVVSIDSSEPLAQRCLSLTGSFETGQKAPGCYATIAGDFDGQGMSFGALQWNFGQGTLQPMLQQMDLQHSDIIDSLFGGDAATLRQVLNQSQSEQMSWVRSIQVGNKIQQPWHDQFNALGFTDEFQQIEVAAAMQRYNTALGWCSTYGVSSERAAALMFDIDVQNGGISAATQNLILQDIQNLQPSGDPNQDEVNKLTIIANRRADAANSPYQQDVRTRKLCIANGTGTVHGIAYDLANDFGIGLGPIQ
jgi:peptidoglycan hydrolase-like protein with peptidoglycan-binding domain